MKKIFAPLLALAGIFGASPAAASSQWESARFITIYVQDKPFQVEIADTPEKHTRGLMFRRCLKSDFGMLFVFAGEEVRSFWMKNTLIPLDMIFINTDRLVVDLVHSATPCTADPCPSYVSACPARFVLELAGGTAKRLKLKIGEKIFIPVD